MLHLHPITDIYQNLSLKGRILAIYKSQVPTAIFA